MKPANRRDAKGKGKGKAAAVISDEQASDDELSDAGPDDYAVKQSALPTAVRPGAAVGTSAALEKSYVRSAGAVDWSAVRPPEVLAKAFARLQLPGHAPLYVHDQLRAIRQDLVIGRVEDQLALDVYVFHARLCLELSDLAEFHACQLRAAELAELLGSAEDLRAELAMYGLIFAQLSGARPADIAAALARAPRGLRAHPALRFAGAVRTAFLAGRFKALAVLADAGPPPGAAEVLRCFRPLLFRRGLQVLAAGYQRCSVAWAARALAAEEAEVRALSVLADPDTIDGKLTREALR